MKTKKKKSLEWKEFSVKPIGLYMSGNCSGPGWGNRGYYCAVYEVMLTNGKDFRTIVRNGPAVREYGEGYDAAISLFQTYYARAKSK